VRDPVQAEQSTPPIIATRCPGSDQFGLDPGVIGRLPVRGERWTNRDKDVVGDQLLTSAQCHW